MNPIPDTDLSRLFESATLNALNERRQAADSSIRQILKRQEAVSDQVRRDRLALEKSEKKMQALAAKIDRLKAGEWQVLAELEREAKQTDQKGAQGPEESTG
jgi:hypothetical protein